MRLPALLALVLAASAAYAQTPDVRSVSGLDLGSGRVVTTATVSEGQMALLRETPRFRRAVRETEPRQIRAAPGYDLYADSSTDGVADCTEATCYVVERVERGERGLVLRIGMLRE
ncbi:MAG: hypothetical protein AAF791_01145 [Bacteroidota bacterium]